MNYEGVVLVGGKGSRLKELTKKTAKPLITIGKRPFLDHLLYSICKYDFKIIYLICSYKYHDFFKKYHRKKILNVEIICILEKKPRGTGGALFTIKKHIKKNFFLFNGDSLFPINLDKFYSFAKKKNKSISIACSNNKNYKSNRKINNIKIKNNLILFSNKKTKIMNGGIYFIKKTFLNNIKNKFSSLENYHLEKLILKKQVSAKLYKDFFIDIGLKKNLKIAIKKLKSNISNKAFFLDRDGVVNEDKGYVFKKDQLIFKKGFFDGLKILNKKKFVVIIITNQSGIGRGYYEIKDFNKITKYILFKCEKKNTKIDDTYYCPHHPLYALGKFKLNCNCRKPKAGMIDNAVLDWSIDLKKSYMIGDKKTDEQAAKKRKITFFYKNNLPFNRQITNILKKNK